MRQKKVKITAEEIVKFFQDKPVFDKSETDASILYGWPSTKNGLYTISDIYKHFEEKGFEHDAVDDVIDIFFQKQDGFSTSQKLEKGKTHYMYRLGIYNPNPEYKQTFLYYFYDLTKEEALSLKKEYETESLKLMANQIERRKLARKKQTKQETKKEKEEKDKPKEKPQKAKAVKVVMIDPTLPELTIES